MFAVAQLWARPRVPVRPLSMSVDEFWSPQTRAASSMVTFLYEGGVTFAALWVMLTGSWLAAGVSLAGIVGMAFNSPERLERPSL